MSTPAQKANLARIRDNQRRSRARRREYLQELEQRLRVCELQGIEASTEVQAAARRVADENRHLRQLLNRHGFSDSYITQYLQTGVIAPPDIGQSQQFHTGDPGPTVQALNQVMIPRRPGSIDPSVAYSLPSQVISDSSISSSPSMSARATWETLPVESSYRHEQPQQTQPQQQHPQQIPTPSQQYSAALFMGSSGPNSQQYMGGQSVMGHQHVASVGQLQTHSNPNHSMAGQNRSPMVYSTAMHNYQGDPASGYQGPSPDYL